MVTTAAEPPVELQPNDRDTIVVKSVSGRTHCAIEIDRRVLCENFDGFPQAPFIIPGLHMNLATVDDSGTLGWNNVGPEDSGLSSENNYLLDVDRTYAAAGWTIRPTSEGTTFTNDRTGHGMSVSIDNANVSAF